MAQVTDELATLFIGENLKAREQMATGTTEFLNNRLQETRKELAKQEAKLRDFKLQHLGELPEQQQATLQILGQLQARLQGVTDALDRAKQQKSYVQSIMAQSAPAKDLPVQDLGGGPGQKTEEEPKLLPSANELELTALLSRYGEKHPDVQRLRSLIEVERETREEEQQAREASAPLTPAGAETPPAPPVNRGNTVLESQLAAIDMEIERHEKEQQRLLKSISAYQAKLEAIPVREQQIADVVRDYEISKEHYSQLLANKLSADTATQLEIRQKGEKFTILDPAMVPEKPSRPNRRLINAAGSFGGLGLGLLAALITEFLGISITSAGQITAVTGVPMLGLIPIIRTRLDRSRRKRWMIAGATSGLVTMLAIGAFLLYHYQIF